MNGIAAPSPLPICPHCGICGGRHLVDCVTVKDKGTRYWLIGMLVTLAMCIDGWGCGGATQQEFGWCCGNECGFSGADADVFEGTCYCPDGIVRPSVESLSGECIEQTDAQKASR